MQEAGWDGTERRREAALRTLKICPSTAPSSAACTSCTVLIKRLNFASVYILKDRRASAPRVAVFMVHEAVCPRWVMERFSGSMSHQRAEPWF